MSARPLKLEQAGARRQDAANMRTYNVYADRRGRSSDVVEWVELDRIAPSPDQKRVEFDEAELRQLNESFGENFETLSQYPTVRRAPDGRGYVLIAGERRVRAALLGGHTKMPVLVKDMSDAEAEVATALENLMRVGLSAWATAQDYVVLRDLLRKQGKRKNAGARSVVAAAGAMHEKSQVESYIRVGVAFPKAMLLEVGAGTGDGEALDPVVMRALTLTVLDAIAKLDTPEARVGALRLRVAEARALHAAQSAQSLGSSEGDARLGSRELAVGASAARALAALAARDGRRRAYGRRKERPTPGVRELEHSGGFKKQLGGAFSKLPAETLDAHAGDVATAFAALAELKRVAGHFLDPVLYRASVFAKAEERATPGATAHGRVMYLPEPQRISSLFGIGQTVGMLGRLCLELADQAATLGADQGVVQSLREALSAVVNGGSAVATSGRGRGGPDPDGRE